MKTGLNQSVFDQQAQITLSSFSVLLLKYEERLTMAPRKKATTLADVALQMKELQGIEAALIGKEAQRLFQCATQAGVMLADISDDDLVKAFRQLVPTTATSPGASAHRTAVPSKEPARATKTAVSSGG